MRILFMGTPDFSVGCLTALHNASHEIVGVFTQPDKPVGRKRILTPPPVKTAALELGIPVFQPATLRDGSALDTIKTLNPDIIVVVAYGKILPPEILDFPKYHCVNVHASLLPKLRGASPIQWSIVTGEKITGVTTMYMDVGMDTGDILDTDTTEIFDRDNAATLFDRLSDMGAKLIVKTIDKLIDGTAVRTKQDESLATYAPIINKEMGLIDFNKSAREIFNLVRGFDPWPNTYTYLDGKRLKVISAEVVEKNGKPGEIISADGEIVVGTGAGAIRLNTVQLEGSRAMSGKELLLGHKLCKGMILGE